MNYSDLLQTLMPSDIILPVNVDASLYYLQTADPQRCFHNATGLIINRAECRNMIYCEGWAIAPVSEENTIDVFEHGWLWDGASVIDPTWAEMKERMGVYAVSYRATYDDMGRAADDNGVFSVPMVHSIDIEAHEAARIKAIAMRDRLRSYGNFVTG